MLKNRIMKSALILLCSLLLWACDKEDNDFTGSDNYITDFKITQGENSYNAVIDGDNIVLTVPEGTSFEGAKAEIKTSENASIAPDPSSITHWGEEYQLIVSSYNQTDRVYKYTIRYSPLSAEGNVTLLTQADVEAFAKKGVSVIDGNLTIGQASGKDSIVSLMALSSLTEVRYNLVIQKNFAAKNLIGFENLTRVGGVKIASVDSLVDVEFPALVSVGTELQVSGGIIEMALFPELRSVGESAQINCPRLLRQDLSSLETIGGALTLKSAAANLIESLSLPRLKHVGGGLTFDSWGSVEELELPALMTCGAIKFASDPVLSSVSLPVLTDAGGLAFTNCKAVERVDCPALESVTGDLSFESMALDNLDGLKSLQRVSGKLNLKALNDLTTLAGLSALESVGIYSLYNLPEIKVVNVTGVAIGQLELFGSILNAKLIGDENFPGTLYINDASDRSYTVFPEMEGFKTIGKIDLYNISYLTELSLPGIVRVGDLNISTGSKLTTFSMPDLVTLGTIKIAYMNSLENFLMPQLKRVEGDMNLSLPSAATKVLAFPELETVGGDFFIQQGVNLSSIMCPKLTTITKALNLSGTSYYKNTALTSLDGFATLSSVGGVTISYYSALVSFEGLKNVVPDLGAGALNVANCGYNPTLEQLKSGAWIKP